MCVVSVLCLVYCVVFFFFKQKTAYEMRISDWSSDVCSSDLLVIQVKNRRGGGQFQLFHQLQVGVQFCLDGRRYVFEGFERAALEIGRASCRERVCQYV